MDVEDDPDEDDMGDVNLDDDRERHWRMVSKENDVGGVMKSNCYMLKCEMSK